MRRIQPWVTPVLLVAVLAVLVPCAAPAQEAAADVPAQEAPAAAPSRETSATLATSLIAGRPLRAEDLAWIAGSWKGQVDGGLIEEMWTAPTPGEKGAMLGSFRWLRGEKVVVYELLSLEPGPQGLTLFLRHFRPGLVALEEKDAPFVFHLVSAAPGEVTFDSKDPARPTRLTYRRAGDDTLIAVLDRTRDGKATSEEFRYSRVR